MNRSCNIHPLQLVLLKTPSMRLQLIITFSTSFCVMSQQETVPNQFWNNYAHLNPSMAGVQYKHQGGLAYQDQWNGIEGAPYDFYVNYTTRIAPHHGIGIDTRNSAVGFSNSTSIAALYSYQLVTKKDHRINLGIAPTYVTQNVSGEWLPPTSLPDSTLPENDRFNYFLVHTGVSFASKHLIAGLGVRTIQLTQSKGAQFGFVPHYYGHASYKVDLGSRSDLHTKHHLILDFLGSTDGVFSQFQGDLRLVLWDKLTILGGYRSGNGLLMGAGWELFEQFRATYSTQLSRSALSKSTLLSHEISLVYKLEFM